MHLSFSLIAVQILLVSRHKPKTKLLEFYTEKKCKSGYVLLEGRCYRFITLNEYWNLADNFCTNTNSYLGTVSSQEQRCDQTLLCDVASFISVRYIFQHTLHCAWTFFLAYICHFKLPVNVNKHLICNHTFINGLENDKFSQESPPAWPQEAYRPLCILAVPCAVWAGGLHCPGQGGGGIPCPGPGQEGGGTPCSAQGGGGY